MTLPPNAGGAALIEVGFMSLIQSLTYIVRLYPSHDPIIRILPLDEFEIFIHSSHAYVIGPMHSSFMTMLCSI